MKIQYGKISQIKGAFPFSLKLRDTAILLYLG